MYDLFCITSCFFLIQIFILLMRTWKALVWNSWVKSLGLVVLYKGGIIVNSMGFMLTNFGSGSRTVEECLNSP